MSRTRVIHEDSPRHGRREKIRLLTRLGLAALLGAVAIAELAVDAPAVVWGVFLLAGVTEASHAASVFRGADR